MKKISPIMQITFYSSIFCPRCFFTRKYLLEIAVQNTDIEIQERDIMLHPLKTWQEGIRMIPTIVVEGKTLGGIFLSKTRIKQFIKIQNSN